MSRPDPKTRKALKRAVDFAAANDGKFSAAKRGFKTTPRNGFVAQLTAESAVTAGLYSWKRVEPSQSTPGDYATDQYDVVGTDNAFELNKQPGLPIDTFVWIEVKGVDDAGEIWYSFSVPVPFVMIPVDVLTDGGTDGDDIAEPTYTYEATSIAGEVLGTGLTPKNQRVLGSFLPADFGSGYFDNSEPREFVLGIVNEEPDPGVCA